MSTPTPIEIVRQHISDLRRTAEVLGGCGQEEVITAIKSVLRDAERSRELEAKNARLRAALEEIARYDHGSPYGEGICPYGCDTPHIAKTALSDGEAST